MPLYRLLRPILFRLEPESAHNLIHAFGGTIGSLTPVRRIIERCYVRETPLLSNFVLDTDFDSPVGLAAGFDKNGKLADFMSSFGFGFIEVGSVTYRATQGNPRPRLFRLETDLALINRMGLNNLGPEAVLRNLKRQQLGVPIGINIAKTNEPSILGDAAIDDMVRCFDAMQPTADYVVLNVSCPNSEDGRTFESPSSLDELLRAIFERRSSSGSAVPILVKFSSDIPARDLERGIEIGESLGVDGYVLVNTTADRTVLLTSRQRLDTIGKGGLSGRPLFPKSLDRITQAYRLLRGRRPIIGVGGVDSAESAYKLIKAGATLIELYTGLVYEGPGLVKRINLGLEQLLKRDGFLSIREAIGIEAR